MQLNDDLETVSKWLNVNRLTLNANKTKTMLFGTQQHLSKREGGDLNSTLTGNLWNKSVASNTWAFGLILL